MIDLDELQKLAEAATPGEWAWASAPADGSDETPAEYLASALTGDGPLFVVWVPATEGDPDGYLLTASTGDGPHASMDAEFIAAANPQAIIELIERLRETERLRTHWWEKGTDALIERDAALARIAEAAKLHRKYTYYDLEDSCPDTTDEHREEHHHEVSDDIGEFYCDQMPTGDVCCDNCRDVNGDRMEWPCPTAVALGLNEGETG